MDICNIFYSTKTDKQGTYFNISKITFRIKPPPPKKTENKPYDITQRNTDRKYISLICDQSVATQNL